MKRLFFVVASLGISVTLCAQNYVLTKSTFSSAGGAASSANYVLKAAAGQSVTGESENASHIEQAGFYTYSKLPLVGIQNHDVQMIPKVFSLSQPWPNPVARNLSLKYGVPRTSRVRIKVYDTSGRVVRSLVNDDVKPGFHTLKWQGETEQGRQLAQGIYFVRMLAPDFQATRKLVFLK
jgi:hypothetical protein